MIQAQYMTSLPEYSPSQSKAARALLGWSQADLAREANVGVSTVADFEREHRAPQAANVEAMRTAFEGQGITFYAGGVLNGAAPPGAASALESTSGRKVFRFFSATDLIQWADRRDAQSKLPELISRLIRADLGYGPKIHFPSDESVQLGGWDGTCVTDTESEHVPLGSSRPVTTRSGLRARTAPIRKRRRSFLCPRDGGPAKVAGHESARCRASGTTFVHTMRMFYSTGSKNIPASDIGWPF